MKMTMGNGFFRQTLAASVAMSILAGSCVQAQRKDRVAFHDNKISVELPGGWKKSDRKADRLIAAFETEDQRSSVFFTLANANAQTDMMQMMEGTVRNYETVFKIKKEGEVKTGQVQGPDKKWSAVFTTLELETVPEPNSTAEPVQFRFYLMLFDTGTQIYLFQGSSMFPVREAREKQIYEMLRSIIATK